MTQVWLIAHIAVSCLSDFWFLVLRHGHMIDINTQIAITISLLDKAQMHVGDIYSSRVIQLHLSSFSYPCDTRSTQKLAQHQSDLIAFARVLSGANSSSMDPTSHQKEVTPLQ